MEPQVGMTVWNREGAFVIERIMTRWGFSATGAMADSPDRVGSATRKSAIAPAPFPDGAIGFNWEKNEFEFESRPISPEWSVGRNGAKIR